VQETKGKNFAALPMELCKVISDYVYTKVIQQKFDSIVTQKNEAKDHDCV
jgi:hypothetical protein